MQFFYEDIKLNVTDDYIYCNNSTKNSFIIFYS